MTRTYFSEWKAACADCDRMRAALEAVRPVVVEHTNRLIASIDGASEEAEGHGDGALALIQQVDEALAKAEQG